MKNNYLKIGFLSTCLILSSLVLAQANKVTICHIPPGNPANAHNITVSINAVGAHLYGNNQHNDFLGDCWAGCSVGSIVKATQGKQSDGTPVATDRSDSSKVLGIPDGNNTPGEFYTLGFGGEIILKMDGGILNRPGNDLYIYETSFGQPDCDDYPEKAEIFVSTDMNSWTSLGIICQDGGVDIAPLDWILYVKVKDVSDPSGFSEVVDGFDLDGIQCIRPQQKQVVQKNESFTIYPIPVTSVLNVTFNEMKFGETLTAAVFDVMGKQVLRTEIKIDETSGSLSIPMSGLSPGNYVLQLTGTDLRYSEQFLKN